LATLFSKIITVSQLAPATWGNAKILLFLKKDGSNLPENFRPIALTSNIGKLFHRILAHRIESYLLDINFLDPTLQKGFLNNINGVLWNTFYHLIRFSIMLNKINFHCI
jgi:hypothetical protein